MNSHSQCAAILAALQDGKAVTPIDALRDYGCFRLSARIKDLRDAGHDIETLTEAKNGKRYARYVLRQPVQRALL